MLDFYRQMADQLNQGPIVLATVVAVTGSVPREVGAKMMVCPNGQIIGTIGGGAGEGKVYQQALEILTSGERGFVEIDLSGAPQRDTQGVCGGHMRVWVERWSGETARSRVQQILQCMQIGEPAALMISFTDEPPALIQPYAGLEVVVKPEGMIEPLQGAPTLLIGGGGHVAVPLAQVAHLAGFQIAVVDDRPEFAHSDRFPQATWVLPQSFEAALEVLPTPLPLYVALVTRGMQHDLAALRVLLRRPTCYLGMIGSRKRVRLVLQTLEQEGFAPAQLAQIYAPIGLDIGALTPGEIAVSIVAELVKVRRGGSGRPLGLNVPG